MVGISRRRALVLAGSLLVLALPSAASVALASDFPAQAKEFVERSAAKVRSEAAGVKAAGNARARFTEFFAQSFDIDALSQGVLGSRWGSLNQTQRNDFRAAFQAFVIKAYADRFYTYAGQPMTVATTEPAANGHVLVRTRVQMPNSGVQTPVDWQVSPASDGARISDVVIDGVSLTRTQRDEFASVMQANGGDVAKLTAMLKDRSR